MPGPSPYQAAPPGHPMPPMPGMGGPLRSPPNQGATPQMNYAAPRSQPPPAHHHHIPQAPPGPPPPAPGPPASFGADSHLQQLQQRISQLETENGNLRQGITAIIKERDALKATPAVDFQQMELLRRDLLAAQNQAVDLNSAVAHALELLDKLASS